MSTVPMAIAVLLVLPADGGMVRSTQRTTSIEARVASFEDSFGFYFGNFALAFTRAGDGSIDGLTMSGPRARKIEFTRIRR